MATSKTHERARSAITGRIVRMQVANRHPNTTVVETYKTDKNGPVN